MVRGQRIADSVRKLIIDKHSTGASISSIGKLLSIPRKTVSGIISAFTNNGHPAQSKRERRGRKSKLSIRKQTTLKATIIKNRKETLTKIACQFQAKSGMKISKAPCGRWIRKIGYKCYKVSTLFFNYGIHVSKIVKFRQRKSHSLRFPKSRKERYGQMGIKTGSKKIGARFFGATSPDLKSPLGTAVRS